MPAFPMTGSLAGQDLGWTNSQVLMRFVLLQAIGTPLLLLLVLKIR